MLVTGIPRWHNILMENVLMLKLTTKQKSNLGLWGSFIAIMTFVQSRLPNGPPNLPGFDAMDAFDLALYGTGIVMILAGLLIPKKEDTPDVKQ